MLVEGDWFLIPTLIHPNGVLSGSGKDSVQASQVHSHQTLSSISLWTLFSVLVRSHVGRGKAVPTRLKAWNCPKCVGILKHSKLEHFG